MKSKLGGHVLVECLVAHGVTHAFGVPGESYLAVLDGFYAQQDKITFIINRHEAGAAFMAEAQGKLTGRAGVCLVTRGPGATNASIGVHTAFQDSTPMVVLVGDVATDARDREAFQEMDYGSFFASMTKRVERIDSVARIPEYLMRAFATAESGRPGPVALILPEDVLMGEVHEADVLGKATAPLPQAYPVTPKIRQAADSLAVAQIAQILSSAQRPIVIMGNINEASPHENNPLGAAQIPQTAQHITQFAQNWQLPVVNAFRYQDSFDNFNPQYAGDLGLGSAPKLLQRISESDCVIAFNTRLGEITSQGYTLFQSPQSGQKLVHIHVDPAELGRVFCPAVALCASPSAAAAALAALPAPAAAPWAGSAEAAHRDYLENCAPPEACDFAHNLGAMMHTAQRLLPADALLCNGAGNFASWLHRYYRYTGWQAGHKTQLAPTNGAMGYGLPAGISAALVQGRTAFVMAGDGDFLMLAQELATLSQYATGATKVIVVLLNNGSYGTIRMHQEREFPAQVSGTGIQNPDFCALARSFGLHGVRLAHSDEFEQVLSTALSTPGSTLIEVVQDPEQLTTRATLSQIRNNALKKH